MNTIELKEKGWLKIGDLAKRAGVSLSTIHYYVQEELLTPPARTSRNMAYYDPVCIEEIRIIQELRTTRYLPLSAIRLLLKAEREGQNREHIGEMSTLFEQVFQPLTGGGQPVLLSSEDLLNRTGLPESSLKKMEENGMISPRTMEGKAVYDDTDLHIAQSIKKLSDYGITAEDLRFYREFLDFTGREIRQLHDLIHRFPEHDKISLTGFLNTVSELKENISRGIYRRELVKMHSGMNNQQKVVQYENPSSSQKA